MLPGQERKGNKVELSKDTIHQLHALSSHLAKTYETLVEELVDIEYYRIFIKPSVDEYNRQYNMDNKGIKS
jgi:hypothetical protein